jgi:hypothetical protein
MAGRFSGGQGLARSPPRRLRIWGAGQHWAILSSNYGRAETQGGWHNLARACCGKLASGTRTPDLLRVNYQDELPGGAHG